MADHFPFLRVKGIVERVNLDVKRLTFHSFLQVFTHFNSLESWCVSLKLVIFVNGLAFGSYDNKLVYLVTEVGRKALDGNGQLKIISEKSGRGIKNTQYNPYIQTKMKKRPKNLSKPPFYVCLFCVKALMIGLVSIKFEAKTDLLLAFSMMP